MNEMTRVGAEEVADVVPAKGKSRTRIAVMLLGPILLILVGGYFWLTSGKTVSTDNAQVSAHVVSIAPEVSGKIVETRVSENQHVNKGDLLYRVDPAPFRIALLQADAALGTARLQVNQLASEYTARNADIGAMTSDVQLAEENFRRQKDLLDRGFTTRVRYDEARAALASARSKQASATADAASARAVVGLSSAGGHPQVEAAMAMRDKAALDLQRTEVHAPMSGTVVQSEKLNPGAMAIAMLTNLSIVGGNDYWIEANFKETQLAKLRVGQPAEVRIDAMPGRVLKARVTSVGAGTGAEFSLLPAQNATGNWVKVTQRVPVRLRLEETPDQPLVAGWSVHVTVRVAS